MPKKKTPHAKTKTVTKPARTSKAERPTLVEPERIERKRYTEKLPCAIDSAMVVLRGDELAKAVREREEFEVENAERNRKARERRAHLDEKISDLATAVEQHSESREVECIDYLERGHIVTIRQDTLEQVGEPKAASAEDLQESIFRKGEQARGKDWPEGENPKPPEGALSETFPDAVHSSFDDDEDDDGSELADAE